MRLSKSSEYAIRLVLWLTSASPKSYVKLSEIASDLDISFYQLSKVAQRLISNGLLDSLTGPQGGVLLASNGDKLTLMDILVVTDADAFTERCILGIENCNEDNQCIMHPHWQKANQSLNSMFAIEIKDLADVSGLARGTF